MPAPRLPFPTTPSEYIQAPVGGWSPDVPTWELAADQAPLLENFQIKPGKIRVRPPYKFAADLTSSAVSLAGWLPFKHGQSMLTKRLFTSGYAVEPQNVHRVGLSVPNTGGTATQQASEDALYFINGSSVTRTAIPGGTSGSAPGWRRINFNGNQYGLTYSGLLNKTLAYNDGVTGWQSVVVGFNTTTTAPTGGAPIGGFDIYGWLNRIWVFGGLPPSGVGTPPASTTTLFFTNPLQSLTASNADWEDPVSGLYNQIEIDGDHGDPGVALASVPAGLILLRQNSVFILRGTDPTSYTIRPVTKHAGCLDARSVVEMDSKVYFMSEQGLMVTDGTQVQNVSGALQDELYRQIATWNNFVFNSTGAWCTASSTSDGKILVTFGSYTTGNVTVNYQMAGAFSAVFDPATGVWVNVSTLVQSNGGPAVGPTISAYGQLLSLGNAEVLRIEDNQAALSVSGPSSLHDVANVGGTTFAPITARWTTKSPQANLGSRGKIQLKRAYLDYAIATGGASGVITLELDDRQLPTGSALRSQTLTLPTSPPGGRQYLQRDEQHEVADLGITVTVAGTDAPGSAVVTQAEVHGVGIEFSATSDMRPTV